MRAEAHARIYTIHILAATAIMASSWMTLDQRRIAKETLKVFAPLARVLGLYCIKEELEELESDSELESDFVSFANAFLLLAFSLNNLSIYLASSCATPIRFLLDFFM